MRLKNLFAEFKAFAFKGNMIDLAVAVVIGAAFSGVIGSLVKDIVMPTIMEATAAVKEVKDQTVKAADKAANAAGITKPTSQPTSQPAEAAATTGGAGAGAGTAPTKEEPKNDDAKDKVVELDWKIGRINIGAFIAELLNFVIVAFAVFIIIVKLLGSVMKKVGGTPKPEEPTTRECPECLSIIPIKAKRCAYCTAVVVPPVTT